jgi:riboflavin biosynthesis pyrimidine reductase
VAADAAVTLALGAGADCAAAGAVTLHVAKHAATTGAKRHSEKSLIVILLTQLACVLQARPLVVALPTVNSSALPELAPAGEPLDLLFERASSEQFALPAELMAIYQGHLGLPKSCVYANFVASLDGLVALPGDTESGQIISGRNPADRFVMGMLRCCADAVLLGAGTFRKSSGHLWQADRIYPPAAALFAEARQRLGLREQPLLALLTASGEIDVNEPAVENAWLFTTAKGAAKLEGKLPPSARLSVLDPAHLRPAEVLELLRQQGLTRILTEGGPSLFAGLVQERLVDELFLTSSPALFGRFPGDERKSLAEGLDLSGVRLELASARRHGSHLFLRYALNRYKT